MTTKYDGKYRVQTRGGGDRGWTTRAILTDFETAMRMGRQLAELRGWMLMRQHQYVQVVHEGQTLVAWSLGRPVLPAQVRVGGVA